MTTTILAWIQLVITPIAIVAISIVAVRSYRSLMSMRTKCCSCEKTKFNCFMYKRTSRCKKCVSAMVIPELV